MLRSRPGFLLLEDGTLFRGHLHAALPAPSVAEVVFTTNMSGYQEVFTDPSYAGQLVVMTAPMIGNCGINGEDLESERPMVAGVVVRELSRITSSWRATGSLEVWLREHGIPIVSEVDTRRLTRHIREAGIRARSICLCGNPRNKTPCFFRMRGLRPHAQARV